MTQAESKDSCEGPAKNANIHVRVLHEACIAVGGEHHLASRLGVAASQISAWLHGHGQPSQGVFLRCLDLIARTD